MDEEEQMLYGDDDGEQEAEQSNEIATDLSAENNANDHVSFEHINIRLGILKYSRKSGRIK